MTVAIDIGASKTLIATQTKGGQIKFDCKFATNHEPEQFIKQLTAELDKLATQKPISKIVIGIAGSVDTKKLVYIAGGVLPWRNFTIGKHLKKYTSHIIMQNDAQLAGLAEAVKGVGKPYGLVLYLTISSGIGSAVIEDKKLILTHSEGGQIIYDSLHKQRFEDISSGKAIKRLYGQYGYQIKSPWLWRKIAKAMAPGIYDLITIIGPGAVVLGGGVSVHYRKFIKYLNRYLKTLDAKIYKLPPVLQAKYVETAVVEGCFIYAAQATM